MAPHGMRCAWKSLVLLMLMTVAVSDVTARTVRQDSYIATASSNSTTSAAPSESLRAPPRPCSCAEGQCGCCTGFFLSQFNVNPRQRGCVNVTYDPDDFALNMALYFNNRILYSNTVSGKNPRPVCVPIPRLPTLRMCVRFSNVYFAGRNIHACVSLVGRWDDEELFRRDLDCVRLGADGVAVVSPEQGGGLPQGGAGGGDEDVEDYEDPDDPDEDDDDDDDDDDAGLL